MRQATRKWRDGLVNLTGTNRLLNFKPGKTGMLVIARPTPGDVLARVRGGKGYSFRPLKPESEPEGEAVAYTPPLPSPDHLDVDKTPSDLAKVMRGLYRKSSQAYLDQGLSILYLVFGVLTWTDVDRTKYTSPLLLVPVRLETTGTHALPTLGPTEDDTLINPALVLKLDQLGTSLPSVENMEEGTLGSFLDTVRKVVAEHPDWTVTDDLMLSYFSFTKEAMYRDLLDNEDVIVGHDAIAAFVVGGGGNNTNDRFVFDEIPDSEIDERAAPETTPVILDADSSQRACIAAALAGKSFVMDGPPGTGKSQTIANIIGVLLHAGKAVLFVSEKAAALDVVRDRLADLGLGPYLLELHSAKATRKQVAEELGRALTTEQVPPDALGEIEVHAARARRKQLNEYADAMNRPRAMLGVSLHKVLGRIALLHDIPAAPFPAISAGDLTVAVYSEIKEAAKALANAWRPARQGASFVWRGVTERGSMDALLHQAHIALATLAGTVAVNRPLAEATGLTCSSDVPALAELIDHLSAKPSTVPGEWLTAGLLTPISDAITKLDTCLAGIAAAEKDASHAAGVEWQVIPRSGTLPVAPDLSGIFPRTPDVTRWQAGQITALAGKLRAGAELLANRTASLTALARMLGLKEPATFAAADDLLAVARLAEAPFHPERTWLTPAGFLLATEAASALRAAVTALEEAETAAQVYYTRTSLREDVDGLASRVSAHHGLGKLSGEYRNDKRTITSFTAAGVSSDAAQQHLGLAVSWKHATQALANAEQAHAGALGAYYTGQSTDFSQVAVALDVAGAAIRLTRGQDMARVADYLARDGLPGTAVVNVGRDIAHDLQDWQTSGMAPSELMGGAIGEAASWLRAQVKFLDAVAAITGTVSEAVGQPLTVGEARHLVTLRDAVDAAYERLTALAGYFGDVLGELYDGPRTDVADARHAFAWASRLRELVTGTGDAPLTEAQAKTIATAKPTPGLAGAVAAWQNTRESLLAAFDTDRRRVLSAELDDYEEADDLIKALRQDTAGQDEWHAYQRARTLLAACGLSAAIAFCVSQRVQAEQVPAIIERALLQAWAEDVLKTDSALSTLRAPDRDTLIAEYRKLDQALISNAVGDVIRACSKRRPRIDIGESATIRREAEKKKKHMPVRTLLERTRNATLAIKPCFMMSPLTVSQFLPPNMRFDVVIFDEASQVLPGDAVNCVYRGSALILAGDQKQLPPTSWLFGGTGTDDKDWSEDSDDTADFESILDLAKSAGVFRNLSLDPPVKLGAFGARQCEGCPLSWDDGSC